MDTPAQPRSYRAPLLIIAVCFYAGMAVAGAVNGNAIFPLVGLLTLLTVLLWPALAQRRRGVWLVWTLAVLLLGLAASMGVARAALDAFAIPVNAAIGWVFARTLRPGQEPLITRMVKQIEGPQRLQEWGVAAYTRMLTAVWAGVLLGQAVILLLIWLALHAALPLSTDSSLALWLHRYLSYGSYLIMGLLFALEYPWRRYCLAHLQHMSFVQVSRRIVANWQRLMQDIMR